MDEKPGRPPVGADMFDRLLWTLWQCYSVHPQDSEARRAHDLIKELKEVRREHEQVAHFRKWFNRRTTLAKIGWRMRYLFWRFTATVRR